MSDKDMPDYKIAGISVFKYIEPRLNSLTDIEISDLYMIYSDEVAAATWLGVTNKGAEQFCKWAFTSPVDHLLLKRSS